MKKDGVEMTEKEVIKEALDLLSDVLCLLFETESDAAVAGAFMADSLVKYLTVVYRGDDVISASCDYTAYEEKACTKAKKKLKELK